METHFFGGCVLNSKFAQWPLKNSAHGRFLGPAMLNPKRII